jgi:hypothetical protein
LEIDTLIILKFQAILTKMNPTYVKHTLCANEYLNGLYTHLQNIPFPWKLHQLLVDVERAGLGSIISWLPDGQSFRVYDQKAFIALILPHYFNITKYKSFLRQLNVYGFERIAADTTNLLSRGGYSHIYFDRGEPNLCVNIIRRKIESVRKLERAKTPFPLPSSSDQSSILTHEEPHQEDTQNMQVLVDEESSIVAPEIRMATGRAESPSKIHAGDTVMFYGKQFYCVDNHCEQSLSSLELQQQQQQQQQQREQEAFLLFIPIRRGS